MREMCTSSVSNVIYHKFSHGTAFYTLNGKNVNVMLESLLLAYGLYVGSPPCVLLAWKQVCGKKCLKWRKYLGNW